MGYAHIQVSMTYWFWVMSIFFKGTIQTSLLVFSLSATFFFFPLLFWGLEVWKLHIPDSLAKKLDIIRPNFPGTGDFHYVGHFLLKPEKSLTNGDELVPLLGNSLFVRFVITAHTAFKDLRKVDAFLLWVAALTHMWTHGLLISSRNRSSESRGSL